MLHHVAILQTSKQISTDVWKEIHLVSAFQETPGKITERKQDEQGFSLATISTRTESPFWDLPLPLFWGESVLIPTWHQLSQNVGARYSYINSSSFSTIGSGFHEGPSIQQYPHSHDPSVDVSETKMRKNRNCRNVASCCYLANIKTDFHRCLERDPSRLSFSRNSWKDNREKTRWTRLQLSHNQHKNWITLLGSSSSPLLRRECSYTNHGISLAKMLGPATHT